MQASPKAMRERGSRVGTVSYTHLEFEYYAGNSLTGKYELLETLPLKVVGVYDNYKYFTLANECYAAPGLSLIHI